MVASGIKALLVGLFRLLSLNKTRCGLNGSIALIWNKEIFGLSGPVEILAGTGGNFWAWDLFCPLVIPWFQADNVLPSAMKTYLVMWECCKDSSKFGAPYLFLNIHSSFGSQFRGDCSQEIHFLLSSQILTVVPICNLHLENHSHLFFECQFFAQLVNQICSLLGDWIPWDFNNWLHWFHLLKLSKFKDFVYIAILQAAIYMVWMNRNSCIFAHTCFSVRYCVDQINSIVRSRISYTKG